MVLLLLEPADVPDHVRLGRNAEFSAQPRAIDRSEEALQVDPAVVDAPPPVPFPCAAE